MPRISKNGDPGHALRVKSRADALTWCRRAHGSNAPAGLWTVGGGSPPACAGGYCPLPLPGRRAIFKAVLRSVGAGQEPSEARLGTPRARATLNGICGDERLSNAASRLGRSGRPGALSADGRSPRAPLGEAWTHTLDPGSRTRQTRHDSKPRSGAPPGSAGEPGPLPEAPRISNAPYRGWESLGAGCVVGCLNLHYELPRAPSSVNRGLPDSFTALTVMARFAGGACGWAANHGSRITIH